MWNTNFAPICLTQMKSKHDNWDIENSIVLWHLQSEQDGIKLQIKVPCFTTCWMSTGLTHSLVINCSWDIFLGCWAVHLKHKILVSETNYVVFFLANRFDILNWYIYDRHKFVLLFFFIFHGYFETFTYYIV